MDDGGLKLYRFYGKTHEKLNIDDLVEKVKNAEGSSKGP